MTGGKQVGLERFKCLLLYFAAQPQKNDRTIVFERIQYKPLDFFQQLPARQVDMHVNLHNHVMEEPPRPISAFCNFANQNYG